MRRNVFIEPLVDEKSSTVGRTTSSSRCRRAVPVCRWRVTNASNTSLSGHDQAVSSSPSEHDTPCQGRVAGLNASDLPLGVYDWGWSYGPSAPSQDALPKQELVVADLVEVAFAVRSPGVGTDARLAEVVGTVVSVGALAVRLAIDNTRAHRLFHERRAPEVDNIGEASL